MSELARRVPIIITKKRINKWFMIGNDVKLASFHEMTDVLDGRIYGEEFAVESAVPTLSGIKGSSKWLPDIFNQLLNDCPNGHVCHDADWCILMWVRQEGNCS